jgi:hypothetical protein
MIHSRRLGIVFEIETSKSDVPGFPRHFERQVVEVARLSWDGKAFTGLRFGPGFVAARLYTLCGTLLGDCLGTRADNRPPPFCFYPLQPSSSSPTLLNNGSIFEFTTHQYAHSATIKLFPMADHSNAKYVRTRIFHHRVDRVRGLDCQVHHRTEAGTGPDTCPEKKIGGISE